MDRFCLGVLSAGLVALLLNQLASTADCLVLAALLLLFALLRCWFFCGCCCFIISLSWQFNHFNQQVKTALAQHSTEIIGTVASIPEPSADGYRFLFRVQQVTDPAAAALENAKLRLRWYQQPIAPRAGQQYRFRLKFKAVHGSADPGSGISEISALVHGVVAQATVQGEGQLLQDQADWRQQGYELLQQHAGQLESYPLLLALTLGERLFSDELWSGLQASGLAHLISISGLHIGLVFGWVLWLTPGLSYLPLSGRSRLQLLWLLALICAFCYCSLAGFAIPTIRALLALLLLLSLKTLLRRVGGWRFSLLLCAGCLLLRPFWLLSISFWLSTIALTLVFLIGWRYPAPRHWRDRLWQFIRYQLLFSLLLLPVTLMFFHGVAPLTFISNLLFVPVVSLVLIPALLVLSLLQILLPPLPWLWSALDLLFWPLHQYLLWLAAQPLWWSVPQLQIIDMLALGLALLLAAFGWGKARWLWVLALSCPLFLSALQRYPTDFRLHLVDVGQGTALVLQQHNRAILYDLGPRYAQSSATRNQLIPYLHYYGIQHVDYVILSHDDADHTGDITALRQAYPAALLVSDITRLHPDLNCRQLPPAWQQLRLTSLWPESAPDLNSHLKKIGNEQSCVVWLQYLHWRILLMGDAGVPTEQQLLARWPQLKADVLVLGHHGSRSASALPFLQQLAPQLLLNSAGFANPYGHPAKVVQQRASLLQLPIFNTAEKGALRLDFSAKQAQLFSWRQQRLVRWVENLPKNAETADPTR